LDTPDGPFTVLTAAGAVIAAGWTDSEERLLGLVHPSLRPAALGAEAAGDVAELAAAAVAAYYAGDFWACSAVPVRQFSGPFRQQVWEVLRQVGPGETLSYTALAALAGRPAAVRAAAGACSHNAAPLFVPCHRIVTASGGLGGFAYGTALKASLLAREKR
jgi:methylated-DNA-[protein]-cysteine S-methyltransferase